MALSEKVKSELLEAQSHLRAALRDSAVNENSYVCVEISKIIAVIDNIENLEKFMDTINKFGGK